MTTKRPAHCAKKELHELKLWLAVVQRTVHPTNGTTLTPTEKDTLARCCRALAHSAENLAEKITS